jgi:hypothetical protein
MGGETDFLFPKALILKKSQIFLSYLKVQCHKIVCQLRPLVSSSGLNNMPRNIFKLVKSPSKIYNASNRGPLDVKWQVLDSPVLLNSALQCRGLPQ